MYESPVSPKSEKQWQQRTGGNRAPLYTTHLVRLYTTITDIQLDTTEKKKTGKQSEGFGKAISNEIWATMGTTFRNRITLTHVLNRKQFKLRNPVEY